MKIPLDRLKPNPFRDFSLYPLDEQQVQRLSQSIGSLGFFASVSARPAADGYELAAGHHRVAAARLAGLTQVEATVRTHDDAAMVRIMAAENLDQRGHNAAAVLDSVAAYARLVTRNVFLKGDAAAQADIAKEGPDRRLLYQAINGFTTAQARFDKARVEHISSVEIRHAVGALRASGKMAEIVAQAFGEVEDRFPPVRRKSLRKAITRQLKEEAVYDIVCGSAFRLPSHEAAFRKSVTTKAARSVLPVEKQLPLAKQLRKQIDEIEDKRRHDLGSITIASMLNDLMRSAIETQREITQEERGLALMLNDTERVRDKSRQLAAAIIRLEGSVKAIAQEVEKWNHDNPFPIDVEAVVRAGYAAEAIIKLKEQLGLKL